MKKLLTLFTAALILTGCNIGFSSQTTAVDDFFDLLAAGDTQEAYDSTAENFKTTVSFEDFTSYVTYFKLDQYDSRDWEDKTLTRSDSKADSSFLSGSIFLEDEKELPATIELIYNEDDKEWEVLHFTIALNTLTEEDIPTSDVLKKVSNRTIMKLIEGIRAGDLEDFYTNHTSTLLKMSTTVEDLELGFQNFIDQSSSIPSLTNVYPTINEAILIENDSLLKVSGSFDHWQAKVEFIIIYVLEDEQWMPINIELAI